MTHDKNSNTDNKLFSTILNEAINLAINGHIKRLNSAYLLVGYFKALEKLQYNIAENLEIMNLSLNTIYESLAFLESRGYFGEKQTEQLRINDIIIPSYITERTPEFSGYPDSMLINCFIDCISTWKLIDDELEELLLNIGVDITDLALAVTDIVKIKDSKPNQEINIQTKDSNKQRKNKEEDNNIKEISDPIVSRCIIPEFLTDMIDEIEEDDEIILDTNNYTSKILDTLCRKKKSSICLVGDTGIGKTSIAKHFMKSLISNDNLPKKLKNVYIFRLELAKLMCSTEYRGEFEEKIDEMTSFFESLPNASSIILYLDELSQYANTGATDTDNTSLMSLLSRYINSGTISILSTCESSAYHKFIEVNKQIASSIQVINIKEPSEKECLDILTVSKEEYEKYHEVEIPNSILKETITLCNRYIKNIKLPEKVIKVIDQASAIANINNSKKLELKDILKVISDISEIDITEMKKTEETQLKDLDSILHKTIISQDNAVDTVVRAIRRGKLGISNPEKPIVSLLFVGPTGVGKTELTKQIHKIMFKHKESMLRLDMSEFSEEASVSKLIGSAPGYIGYENGGRLTEYVKHNPSSIILFDEIEKAHPKIYNSLLQVLDNGILTDNLGETVDFKDCIIIMTSNAGYGADGLGKESLGFNTVIKSKEDKQKETEKKVRTALESTFRPEFLNRIDSIVLFNKLTREDAEKICKLMLNKLKNRLQLKGYTIEFTDAVIKYIVNRGYSDKYGARNIQREIQDTIEDEIATMMINHELSKSYINIIDILRNNTETKIVLTKKKKSITKTHTSNNENKVKPLIKTKITR